MNKLRVLIKLGGSSLQNETVVFKLAELVKLYQKNQYDVFVVHGGGPAINAELTARGISWTFLNGQRITTPEMISTIEMVLKGKINGSLVRALNQAGIASIGVSGGENFLLECEQANPELQQVGKIISVNTSWLEGLSQINGSTVPVVAPLGVDKKGLVYNINADWAAAKIAMSLKVDELVYLTDQKGILGADKTLLNQLNLQSLQNLIDTNVVQGGMLAKTQTIMAALQDGVKKITIRHAEDASTGYGVSSIGTHCSLQTSKESAHASI